MNKTQAELQQELNTAKIAAFDSFRIVVESQAQYQQAQTFATQLNEKVAQIEQEISQLKTGTTEKTE